MSAEVLFARYKPLAIQIARGFMRKLPRSVLVEDVEAAALMGLWDAASRGAPHESFEWYARVRIRGSIQDELRRQDWLPRRARQREGAPRICSLDEIEHPDGVSALWVPPDAELVIDHKERAQVLVDRLALLPEREASLIAAVLEGVPHWEIAQRMGISEPRVSQLRSRAEARLLGKRLPADKPRLPRASAKPTPIPRSRAPRPVRPAPAPLWRALTEGELQYVDHLMLEDSWVLRLRRPRKPRPLSLQHASVLQHWLLSGKPTETAAHFGISRSHVVGIADTSLRAMGFVGTPAQAPIVFAVAALTAARGHSLEALPGEDGLWGALIARNQAFLMDLSVAEKELVLGLLNGESRETMAAHRGTSCRTISNQLRSAFRKIGVSTASELRAQAARHHAAPAPSALPFSELVA